MTVIKAVLKIILLGLAVLVGQIAGGAIAGLLLQAPAPALPRDGPFDLTEALLLVTAADTMAIALYAARLRGGFVSRTLTVFTLFYLVSALLSVIETVYFNAYVKLPPALVGQMALSGLIQSAIIAPVAATLWRGGAGEAESISGVWWRLLLIALIYPVIYFGAGAMIAWQGAELRTYYDMAKHIDHKQLALLQVARGLVWAGLAWMSVQRLTGSRWPRALITGVAFAVIMVMPLVIPNPYMPWAVRKWHFLEIISSNVLFGVIAAGILLLGMKSRKA